MGKLLSKAYHHPVNGTGFTNRNVYKFILRFNDSWLIGKARSNILAKQIKQSKSIKAYREIYKDVPNLKFNNLPTITKQNFHLSYPNITDRMPDGTDMTNLHIVKTSGSTSGKPSEIPLSENDILFVKNYYRLFGHLAKELMPLEYKYINMFPTSNSSTGVLSEQIVPNEFRLGRSNADPAATCKIIQDSFDNGKLKESEPLILGGLPILHLEFLNHLRSLGQEQSARITKYLKDNSICLYGGESPTISERLKLFSSYKKMAGVFGSTELGPKLGFSIEANLVFDIALTNKNILIELDNDYQGDAPITFFHDKYLHKYEVMNHEGKIDNNSRGNLVITPLIQQSELKIKWDQDDYVKLINAEELVVAMKKYNNELMSQLKTFDSNYGTSLEMVYNDIINTAKYENLIKYFGLMLFYGRRGIIFGGANLDNAFVEIVFNKLKEIQIYNNNVNYLAIYREPINNVNIVIGTNNYSGLRLDIAVETVNNLNIDEINELKIVIIDLMREQHNDFKSILEYYEHNNKLNEILANMHIHAYPNGASPMHKRFIASKKRIHIFKKIDDADKQNRYIHS
jgi:hypothetical protein